MKRNPAGNRPSVFLLLGGVILGAIILVGSFCNLANYPTIWWDEAIFSETAANLVQHGRYAFTVQSPDQLSDLDFRISVGPAVILPVALAYHILGVGVIPGRLVAGLYLVLTFLGLFWGARRLWGARTALVAVVLALGGTDVFFWGRSVLGDIPALGLFLCGLGFLTKGLEEDSVRPLFLGGVFLGLAFDAKEFYGLAFLPPILVMTHHFWPHKGRLLRRLLAYGVGLSLPLLGYIALKWLILGNLGTAVLHFFQQKQLLCHEFFTPFTIGRLYPESALYFLGHPLSWLGVMGVWWIWRRGAASPGERLWAGNFLLWSLFYLTSVYWQRFALPALFLAAPLAAYFLGQAMARLTPKCTVFSPRWLTAGMALAFLMIYPLPAAEHLDQIVTRQADSPSRLVDYLRNNVSRQCLIETPEYELVFLDDDHQFHLMPEFFFLEATPEKIELLNPRGKPYDFDRVGAEVLILGNVGKGLFRQIYPPERIARWWLRVAQVECYDIYVSRKGGAKWLKRPPGPLSSIRVDGPLKPKFSPFEAPIIDHQLYH